MMKEVCLKGQQNPSDRFVGPFANDQEARDSIIMVPIRPDLSVIAKARKNGANYIYQPIAWLYRSPEQF